MCLCTPCLILRHMSNDGGKEFSLLQETTFVAIWENWEYQARRHLLLCAIDLYISLAVRVCRTMTNYLHPHVTLYALIQNDNSPKNFFIFYFLFCLASLD